MYARRLAFGKQYIYILCPLLLLRYGNSGVKLHYWLDSKLAFVTNEVFDPGNKYSRTLIPISLRGSTSLRTRLTVPGIPECHGWGTPSRLGPGSRMTLTCDRDPVYEKP